MSQDIVSDALNKIMNAKKAKKDFVIVNIYSKVLTNVLEIMKREGYIKNFKTDKTKMKIEFDENLNLCKSIKPRYNVGVEKIPFYMKRYLPARDVGLLIVSTNQGLLTHKEALEKNIGGALIAYFY